MVWAANNGEGFKNFYECYNANIVNLDTSNDNANNVKDFFQNDIGDGMRLLEDEFECAGYCYTGMFSIARDISEGPAETDCLNASIDAMQSSSVPVGVVGVITGIALLIAFCFSFPLCCKSCIREEDKQ